MYIQISTCLLICIYDVYTRFIDNTEYFGYTQYTLCAFVFTTVNIMLTKHFNFTLPAFITFSRQAQQKGKTMFYKKAINDLYHKINGDYEWTKKKFTEYENSQKWIIDEIKKLQDFQTKIENAVPTFNKMIEKQKEMNTYIQGSTKLFQRIIKYIKLPKIETKGK